MKSEHDYLPLTKSTNLDSFFLNVVVPCKA